MQLKQDGFRKLISCQSDGISAALLRFLLTVAAVGYSIAVGLRNFLYSKGWLTIHRAKATVISIGNITVGGTGKTPLVIWLCNLLRQKNVSCAILTRGYKATQDSRPKTQDSRPKTQDYGDEPEILATSCPQAKVIVNPDRVAGAAEALDVAWPSWPRFHLQITGRMPVPPKVLIMDDGFQHRRLARDLDIITIDATQPFGYGKLLPAGLLREPVTALKRADAVVITRCDQIKEDKLAELEQKLQQINGNMIIARSIHAPISAKSTENKEINLEKLKDKKIFAFCGIGNPDAFFKTIKGLGSELVGSKIYNDHHHYTENDVADTIQQAGRLKADLILTTQKDWSKLTIDNRKSKINITFAYLSIELKFLAGENKLTALIENTITDKIYAK